EVTLNSRVLGFALAATLLSGMVAGVLPAIAASRIDVQDGLKDAGRLAGPQRHRLRNGLVVGQLALSILLLATAGVLLRTFERLQRVDLGFQPAQILTARFAPAAKGREVLETLIERLQAYPQVTAVGAIS